MMYAAVILHCGEVRPVTIEPSSTGSATARVFRSGRSQAVRLLRAFRLKGTEARIGREGDRGILEPIPEGWDWLDAVTGPVDEDFAAAATERREVQDRDDLAAVFD
jgi:antitoxin VapB